MWLLLFLLLVVLACVVWCILAESQELKKYTGRGELQDDALRLFLEKTEVRDIWKAVWQTEHEPCENIEDIPHDVAYVAGTGSVGFSRHIGQRKLFDSELQFLNCLKSHTDSAIVVYAGSSPCNHMFYLHTLFPNVRFILVDPNETLIYVDNRETHHLDPNIKNVDAKDNRKRKILYAVCSDNDKYKKSSDYVYWYHDGKTYKVSRSDAKVPAEHKHAAYTDFIDHALHSDARIFVIEDYYTPDMSDLIRNVLDKHANKDPVYFWSDIRTNSGDAYPKDADLLWNMAQQYIWTHVLDPDSSMLKFRVPFFSETYEELTDLLHSDPYKQDIEACVEGKIRIHNKKISFPKLHLIKDYKAQTFRYFTGQVKVQAYAGAKSTESRLVSTREQRSNIITYDPVSYDAKFFYYNMIQRPLCLHRNPDADPAMGYDLCGDCALESKILNQYKQKNPDFQVAHALSVLATMTARPLLEHGHGTLFKHFTMEWYVQQKKQIIISKID
jgi:hypothetical protein